MKENKQGTGSKGAGGNPPVRKPSFSDGEEMDKPMTPQEKKHKEEFKAKMKNHYKGEFAMKKPVYDEDDDKD